MTIKQTDLLKKPVLQSKVPRPKVLITIRLDADLVKALKATGRGWQTRVNDVLRKHLDELGA